MKIVRAKFGDALRPLRLRMAACALAGVAAMAAPTIAVACDVALALTIDVSGSVDPREYRVQMQGLAEALDDGDVREALIAAQAQIAVMQWSGTNRQKVIADWASTGSHAEIDELIKTVSQAPRAYRHFSTAIGDAVLAATVLHSQIAGKCSRSVIDVSGDGQSNEGVSLTEMRQMLALTGITVNALAIEKDNSDLSGYFRREVMTGPGAFVITAVDFTDYARAIRRKLLREIATPIVENTPADVPADAPADTGRATLAQNN